MELTITEVMGLAGGVLSILGTAAGVAARILLQRMKTITDEHTKLAEAFNDHREEVPKLYVTKEDLKGDLDDIKRGIDRVTDFIMRGDR